MRRIFALSALKRQKRQSKLLRIFGSVSAIAQAIPSGFWNPLSWLTKGTKMVKVIEVEKVGKRQRQTILYSGESEQMAQRIAHFETQAYHRRKDERRGGELVITLTVDS
jgi:hypothetical protein